MRINGVCEVKGNLRLRKVVCFLFMISVMAVIFSFSAQPRQVSNHASSGFTEMVVTPFTPIPPYTMEERMAIVQALNGFIRKCAHFFLYAVLGIAAMLFTECYLPRKKAWLLAAAVCLMYAAGDEFHQLFVPGRGAQVRDVLLDFCGSLAGVGFVAVACCLKQWFIRKKAH